MGWLLELHPSNKQEPFIVGANADGKAQDDWNGFAVDIIELLVEVMRGAEADSAAPAVEILLVTQLDVVHPSHAQEPVSLGGSLDRKAQDERKGSIVVFSE